MHCMIKGGIVFVVNQKPMLSANPLESISIMNGLITGPSVKKRRWYPKIFRKRPTLNSMVYSLMSRMLEITLAWRAFMKRFFRS
jgi:hypothetical protein